jgi:hypothetical protein
MAELALGLTKTVVEGALSRVQTAIEEEEKLKEKVQQDLVFITGEFQMMQSFLKVATKERARNEVVRTWVRQLRDLAFDVEDCVEFVIHLDARDTAAVAWWRNVVVPSCLAPPRRFDEAAAEIKMLKARVEDVSQRNTRYNLLVGDGAGSKADTPPAIGNPNPSSSTFEILHGVWRDETDRLRGVASLQKLIITTGGEKELQVISLLGSESDNLEAVINKAYRDPEICNGFQRRARVKVTRPFNLKEILNSLVAQLLLVGSSRQATSKGLTGAAELIIRQVIDRERYLVVLEQVSDAAEWDAIKAYLPDNKNGSRIIMSTQLLGIALYCTGESYLVSELRQFSDGRPSLYAFYRKVNQVVISLGSKLYMI